MKSTTSRFRLVNMGDRERMVVMQRRRKGEEEKRVRKEGR